ncbi:MAG: DUF5686 and carboxypeptidase regulatory-like domain-containing protein [Chitinophagales bacterium]
MTIRILFLFIVFFFSIESLLAGGVQGYVKDETGAPLAFVNVFIPSLQKGTTTNEDGYYKIELPSGTYNIQFQFIGFERKEIEVELGSSMKLLNLVMNEEEIQLNEVVVSADAEDPAYAIMRKVIEKREYHLNQVQAYQVEAYVKGLQRILSAPDKIMGQSINIGGVLDSNNSGIIYLSESISDFYYKAPNKTKEIVKSSKVSGSSQTFTWNSTGGFQEFNFYKNNFQFDFLTDRLFVSPISDNAFFYYDYRLEGFFEEDGHLINKIKVIPKRQNDPVFSGYIYIVEDTWNIHSLDLMLTKANQVKFIDTLEIRQNYFELNDTLWMPLSQRFDFNFNILKINAEGYFIGIFSNYKINPDLPDDMFSNELLRIEDKANQLKEDFWEEYRPIPLTETEKQDYYKKEKLEELRKSKTYLDSVDRMANSFTPSALILGYTYQRSYKKWTLQTKSLLDLVQFNTVEGFNFRLDLNIRKELKNARVLNLNPVFRYGLENTHFNTHLASDFTYNPKTFGRVEFDFGQYVFQYNNNAPVNELVNTFYSLFYEVNYLKIFEERYINLGWRQELFNGFFFFSKVHYGQRNYLENTSDLKVVDRKGVDYSSNQPVNNEWGGAYQDHNTFNLRLRASYRPGQKYISRPDQKLIFQSKWPTFGLTYKKSVPGIFESVQNYDFLEFDIQQEVKMGLFGRSKYLVKLGSFLNKSRVEFPDFKHFDGNRTIIGQNYADGFQMLHYYRLSTISDFVEAHFQHNFDGFLLNKIPGVRKLNLQLVGGAHFIYSEANKDYLEIDVGIENIFRVIRVDFITALSSQQRTSFGFRIGIDLNSL